MSREDIIKIIEAHTKGNYLMGSMSKQKIADEILNSSQQSTISDEEIKTILIQFMDSIRDYTHESGNQLHYDQRESKEFVDIFMRHKLQPSEPINKGLLEAMKVIKKACMELTTDPEKVYFIAIRAIQKAEGNE